MPRKKSTTDEVILEAAKEVFLADGIGASTKKIAAAAGVSEGVLFQRFGSKQILFFKAMRTPAADMSEAVALSAQTDDPEKALLVLAGAALEYFRSIMPIVVLVFAHPLSKELFHATDVQAEEILDESFGVNQSIRNFFDRQVENHNLRQRDYEMLTTILLSTLLNRALHEQIGVDKSDSAQPWLQAVIKVLID